jgi:hypothetical protein
MMSVKKTVLERGTQLIRIIVFCLVPILTERSLALV